MTEPVRSKTEWSERGGLVVPDAGGESHEIDGNPTVEAVQDFLDREIPPVKGSGAFGIGSMVWPGIGKLLEEMGEVAQMASKLVSTDGQDAYWDGTNLREELCGEIGDLLAAIAFLSNENHLDTALIQARMDRKLTLFEKWHKGKQT